MRSRYHSVLSIAGLTFIQMDGFAKNEYRISEPEKIAMKIKTLELDGSLKICTDYQNQAEKALKQLDEDTISYKKRQEKKTWIKAGWAAVVGGEHGINN